MSDSRHSLLDAAHFRLEHCLGSSIVSPHRRKAIVYRTHRRDNSFFRPGLRQTLRVPEILAGRIPASLAGPPVPGSAPRLSPRRRPSVPAREGMIGMRTRLETQVLLKAGHTQADISRCLHLSERSVRAIGQEPPVGPEALIAPPPGRGRPSKVDPFRNRVTALLAEEPELPSLEILRRRRLEGYTGQKSAQHALIAPCGRRRRGRWCASRAWRAKRRELQCGLRAGGFPPARWREPRPLAHRAYRS